MTWVKHVIASITPPYMCLFRYFDTTIHKYFALAPSIFRASSFGRWVVTHSLADFNFHDHRPAVSMNQHLFDIWSAIFRHFCKVLGWFLIASSAYQNEPTWEQVFVMCTNEMVHMQDHLKFENRSQTEISPIPLIIISTGPNYVILCYPEGNFGRNQLLDGSISLSPLLSSSTNDLHVSIASDFHQSFPWLHPTQV